MNGPRRGVRLARLVSISNIAAAVVALSVSYLAVRYLTADHFMVLMKKFGLETDPIEAMFLHAVNRGFLVALGGGLVVACALGYWIRRRVSAPLEGFVRQCELLAEGRFGGQVAGSSVLELERLAQAFNHMMHRLEHTERLRKTLVADVAHELRTPLMNVRASIESIRDGVLEADPRNLQLMLAETDRLSILINHILDLARFEAEAASMAKEPVALTALLSDACEARRLRSASDAARIRCEAVDQEQTTVLADRGRMRQVVDNLLENALRYSPASSPIRIALGREADWVQLSMTNELLSPVAADELSLLFERFYRPEWSRSKKSGGMGLGLTIVKTIVEALGGAVGLDQDGQTFTVWCRMRAAEAEL